MAAKVEAVSPPKTASPPTKAASSPKKDTSPPKAVPPQKDVTSPPPTSVFKLKKMDSKDENSVAAKANKIEAACSPPNREIMSPPKKEIMSPPAKEIVSPPAVTVPKINRNNSRDSAGPPKVPKRENSLNKEVPPTKVEKPPPAKDESVGNGSKNGNDEIKPKAENSENNNQTAKGEESNGVGDKIKKFEKAAEDAGAPAGRVSRAGSLRGRSRTERLGSDSKDDFPPPATPFKDNVHFDLAPVDKSNTHTERPGIMKNAPKWQRSESHEDKNPVIQKPEPQKIIKPEFKQMAPAADVAIRSPSLGAKLPDQFPSHGTAFRNVASPDQARNLHKFNEDVNTQNNIKACKLKTKEKYSVSKGSSYFTRGSEEIWLVKKKDIEEIEERVLDSFRRAGGNICMRSESMRPSSDSGQNVSFSHATMGRNKRQMYARSESLDPQWAGARAQTLKRQTSVACTCGHDKKTRAKSAGADTTPRPRSRSHGDDNNQAHVLDKYETLV